MGASAEGHRPESARQAVRQNVFVARIANGIRQLAAMFSWTGTAYAGTLQKALANAALVDKP
jgi:hypothetical protein